MVARNLLLTGGPPGHPFAALAQTTAAALACDGIKTQIIDNVDTFVDVLSDPGHRPDLITVFTLRFLMEHPRYDDVRERWAETSTERTRQAIESYVAGGGGLLAVHTACVCFDDWAGWGDLLGASWDWEQSSHEPIGPALIASTDVPHPITHGIGSFAITDEIYEALVTRSDFETLLTSRRAGAAQPLLWTRNHGDGRVVVDTLGHSIESLTLAAHDLVLRRSAQWAVGASDDAVRALKPKEN